LTPPLLSAGVIARRGDGGVALREIDGAVLRETSPPVDFRFDSTFRVASVSKMVTAAGFMRLVAAGAVELGEDISTYLAVPLRHPAFPEIPITPRMLLSHTSGIRNGADFPLPFSTSLPERLRRASTEPDYGGWFASLGQRPGVHFGYSDVNFGVIAEIIERLTGERFDRYMSRHVFEPLELDVGYNWSGASQTARDRVAAAARLVEGSWSAEFDASPPPAPGVSLYQGDAPQPPRLEDYELGENGLGFSPHGGLRVSLADMDALARVFARGDARVLGRDTLRAMQRQAWRYDERRSNGTTENGFYQRYGLGVHLSAGRGARDAFAALPAGWRGHFGDAYGWMTGLIWNARTRDTIVYALNGMPETARPPGSHSALTAAEEALVTRALGALSRR
jgi:CubicO group peptidase (beta-lactamase class C family)